MDINLYKLVLKRYLWPLVFFAALLGLRLAALGRGCVLKRLRNGLTVRIQARQQQDPLLRLPKLRVATLEEPDALFIARQSIFQTKLAVFQIADDLVELGQGLFESQRICQGVQSCVPPTRGVRLP